MTEKTALIKEAQKYLAKGQIDKALGEWEKIVKAYPDGNNYNYIGDLYLKKGDKKIAVESYHKAANIFRHEGFSLKALALFKKVLNVDPADAAALCALGELSEEKELITDAIKYYLATADSLAKEGKKDELFNIYEKILSLSPSNIPLRTKVAEILFKEGLKSDAAKEYLYIAGIYNNKGDFQKSREYYQKTIDMQPLSKDAIVGLSLLYEKTGEIDKALELIKEASVLFQGNVEVLIRAAELSLAGNYTENAKAYLCRIIETEPKNTKARRLLGDIYLNEDQKERALQEYLIVLDNMILEEKYDDAIKILESFKEIDPVETCKRLVSLYKQLREDQQVVKELICLGDAYYDRGIRDEALVCYNEAIELAPDNDYLPERIAELTGKHKEQVHEFTTITEHENIFEAAESEVSEHISLKAEKTVDEVLTEADIFARYGLLSEAKTLLEGLKLRVPENIDLHQRLKTIYSDIDDKESAVTECLILSELYKRNGDIESSEKILKESCEISPSDPRLSEKEFADLPETASPGSKDFDKFAGAAAGEEALIENYEEELAEADFYTRQGLVQEALKILLKLQGLFPENRDVAGRLESLGGGAETLYASEVPEITEKSEMSFELSQGDEESPEAPVTGEPSWGKEVSEKEPAQKTVPDEELGEMEYEDFSISENELVEAQEMSEPILDNDVLEIFQEFKKGLESQLEDEDSETHYNLGIAYKEMGLVEDAIKEFQTAKHDKKRFLQASSMLGICYMEKGLYSLAVDVLNKTLDSIKEQNDSYWSIKYDLAWAHEKSNNLKEALELYTEVYGWNAKFRDVSEKVSLLKTQAGKSAGKEKPKERKDRVSYL